MQRKSLREKLFNATTAELEDKPEKYRIMDFIPNFRQKIEKSDQFNVI